MSSSRIIGSMVVRNEMDRYLDRCLAWMSPIVDDLYILDDQSTDGTYELCRDYTDYVTRRPDDVPSFLEHEGKFRTFAFDELEHFTKPALGDWILSFDADEFLVASNAEADVSEELRHAIRGKNVSGIVIDFKEIFKIDGDDFYYRTDGYWDAIRGPRLYTYQMCARFNDKAMASGSEPTYVATGRKERTDRLTFIHLGYARDEDKQSKYERYSSLFDHGHNDSHIQSIIKKPDLAKLEMEFWL